MGYWLIEVGLYFRHLGNRRYVCIEVLYRRRYLLLIENSIVNVNASWRIGMP